jgi:hypothetical protein
LAPGSPYTHETRSDMNTNAVLTIIGIVALVLLCIYLGQLVIN